MAGSRLCLGCSGLGGASAPVVYITGIVRTARPVVFAGKSAILLSLKGRSETFIVRTVDAPKFGLLKAETAAAAPDKEKMEKELEAVKGWRVKLAVEFAGDQEKREHRVKTLERLPEKK